uniref:Protein hunchback n=1 Tax=Culicoides sonorensis TaxID=179676 RepID=A0A336LVJ8_CULSO
MMTSSTASYESNWNNIAVKSETEQHLESDSPTTQFDTKNMFLESNISTNNYHLLGFNPLTPPGYPNVLLPSQARQAQTERATTPLSTYPSSIVSQHTSLTPTHTPPIDETPPKSPKEINETPEKKDEHMESEYDGSFDDNHSEHESDYNDDHIKAPKVNSHGKVKTHKCKQCGYVAVTKIGFWEHTKTHLKPEKMLVCPKCPFVTEYKHHLEYHLRNHQRSKPFQCPNCSYSCVNKSMLNSHLKSHSAIFQYRCADCNYATKYCHSLKLHLRKYSHKPDVVLNQDGTPNPLPIIDVYGTRRGPKTKANQTKADLEVLNTAKKIKLEQNNDMNVEALVKNDKNNKKKNLRNEENTTNMMTSMLPSALANMFQNPNPSMPLFPYLNLNLQMFAAQQQAISQLSPNFSHSPQYNGNKNLEHESLDVLNLSQNNTPMKITGSVFNDTPKQTPDQHMTPSGKSRRKGRAYKLSTVQNNHETERPSSVSSNDNSIHFDRAFTPLTTPIRVDTPESATSSIQPNNITLHCNNNTKNTLNDLNKTTILETASIIPKEQKRMFECKFCDISFKDDVLYTIHMGYHGYNDVFKCNMCGEKCDDRVSFFLHIARSSHA